MRKKKLVQVIAVLACFILILGASVFGGLFAANKIGYGKFANTDYVYQIAHRGYSDAAPENTIPAFVAAGKNGSFYGAECDVRLTKDGVWVVFHDEDVARMTDGEGKVSDFTYEELSRLVIDNGSNIADYPNLQIPLLTQYLDICAHYGLHPFIEIKESSAGCVDSFYALLAERKMTGGCSVLSFHKEIITALHEKESTMDLFFLTKNITNSDIRFCADNNCVLSFKHDAARNTVSRLNKALGKGLTLSAWTVSSTEDYIRLIDNGVLFITCNSPIEL